MTRLPQSAASANAAWYDSLPLGAYLDGAPHLKHPSLRIYYSSLVQRVFRIATQHTPEPRVLDLGAGEGSVTIPFLALGALVTAVDVSSRQLDGLVERCALYESSLELRCGDVQEVIAQIRQSTVRYDVVVANSFLHHIPDYVELLRQAVPVLTPSGVIFTFQDPLFFSRLGIFTRSFGAIGYFAWRLGRPDRFGGVARRIRRIFGIYHADSQEDNAEYHVVRGGVDDHLIEAELRNLGFQVEVIRYFSAQLAIWQWMGTALGLQNTFAVIASRGA